MVFTLQRYILGELLKVFTLTALALTLILSLGMILEPVSQYGVGPTQVIHLIGYFLPITLTFVLPIAALFAAASLAVANTFWQLATLAETYTLEAAMPTATHLTGSLEASQ